MRLIFALTLSLGLSSLANAQDLALEVRPGVEEPRVTLRAAEQSLGALTRRLAQEVRRTLLVAPDYADTQITLEVVDLPWSELIRRLARASGTRVEWFGPAAYLTGSLRATVSHADVHASTLFVLVAAYSGKNVIVAPDVTGSVHFHSAEATFEEWFERTARAVGAWVTRVGEVYVVSMRPLASGLVPQARVLTSPDSSDPPAEARQAR